MAPQAAGTAAENSCLWILVAVTSSLHRSSSVPIIAASHRRHDNPGASATGARIEGGDKIDVYLSLFGNPAIPLFINGFYVVHRPLCIFNRHKIEHFIKDVSGSSA